MLLDLHTHSVSSDDSRATAEQYAKWAGVLRRKGYTIDGFVLTEHRKFDFDADYSSLAEENGLLILKGSELDTNCGHFLVYGVTEALCSHIDFADVSLDAVELIRAAEEHGGVAVPAHPGRFGIGLYDFIENGADFSALGLIERLNGSDRSGEQERAEELIARFGYAGTGGSDAHLSSALGACMTRFQGTIEGDEDLVRELRAGNVHAVHLQETKLDPSAHSGQPLSNLP
jgi:predicted metal-dependent phosphoesterase TrpH